MLPRGRHESHSRLYQTEVSSDLGSQLTMMNAIRHIRPWHAIQDSPYGNLGTSRYSERNTLTRKRCQDTSHTHPYGLYNLLQRLPR